MTPPGRFRRFLLSLGQLLAGACLLNAADADRKSLQQLIDRVKANEKLFANFEITIHEKWRNDDRPRVGVTKGASGVTTEQQMHAVVQDGLTYVHYVTHVLKSDGSKELHAVIESYDGTVSRVASNMSKAVIVRRGQIRGNWIPLPNNCLYSWNWGLSGPLSEFLAAKKIEHRFAEIGWRVEGEEKINGLPCVFLECRAFAQGQAKRISQFWLALDRNYLPIKVEDLYPEVSRRLPMASRRVTEFKEAASGIWLPSKISSVFYDRQALIDGNLVIYQERDQVVEKATLNPRYPIEYFRDIQIPVVNEPVK